MVHVHSLSFFSKLSRYKKAEANQVKGHHEKKTKTVGETKALGVAGLQIQQERDQDDVNVRCKNHNDAAFRQPDLVLDCDNFKDVTNRCNVNNIRKKDFSVHNADDATSFRREDKTDQRSRPKSNEPKRGGITTKGQSHENESSDVVIVDVTVSPIGALSKEEENQPRNDSSIVAKSLGVFETDDFTSFTDHSNIENLHSFLSRSSGSENKKILSDSSCSSGISAGGDSFVLPIDWNYDFPINQAGMALFDRNPNDQSFEDPYLENRQKSHERLCGYHEKNRHPELPSLNTIALSNVRKEKEMEKQRKHYGDTSYDEAVRSQSTVTAKNIAVNTSKSLGSFDFPFDTSGLIIDEVHTLDIPRDRQNPNYYKPVDDTDGVVPCDSSSDDDDYSDTDDVDYMASALRASAEIHSVNVHQKSQPLPLSNRARSLKLIDGYKLEIESHYEIDYRQLVSQSLISEICSTLLSKQELRIEAKKFNLFSIAKIWMELGVAQLSSKHLESAFCSFLQAAYTYRASDNEIALACALDRAGVAYGRALKQSGSNAGGLERSLNSPSDVYLPAGVEVSSAMQFLRNALEIRQRELGPWHVDTVDTLNHMAALYMLTGNPAQAAAIGEQVFHLRRSIFGPLHPATAVTAHEIANASVRVPTIALAKAIQWYDVAVDIYRAMGLPTKNPAFQNLMKDIQRLERIEQLKKE